MIDGELTLKLGTEGETATVSKGQIAMAPPMVVHGFGNTSGAEVRYLNLHAPGQGFATFMRGLRDAQPVVYDQHDPPTEGARPISDAVIAEGELDSEHLSIATHSKALDLEGDVSHFVLEGAVELIAGQERLGLAAGDWADAAAPHRAEPTPGSRWLSLRLG